MIKGQFESLTSPDKSFDIVVNKSAPENEISESATAAINYLMLKHGVTIAFYHALTKRFKKLPQTYKVSTYILTYIG